MKIITYMILLFVLVGCNQDDSNSPKMTIFELTTQATKPIENVHIYAFNDLGELRIHAYYSTVSELASTFLDLGDGSYTFVAVCNTGENFAFPDSKLAKTNELSDIMLLDFITWLTQIESEYDNMLTGMKQVNIKDNTSTIVKIEVKEKSIGLKFNTLRLNLALPNLAKSSKGDTRTHDYNLRATVEVYPQGLGGCIHRYSTILSGQTFDLNLQAGDYDILLWVDYIPTTKLDCTDHYYTTSQLRNIKFSEITPYTVCTDSRYAYSLAFETTVEEQEITNKSIILERPLAKYRIIATDVECYRTFERINDYPLMEELTVSVSYEYLPNSFDVKTSLMGTIEGIKYSTPIFEISNTTVTIGSDYIFVNDIEPIVYTTITITDKSGRKIAEIADVKIDYRRNYITTISGDFLTAGVRTSDINININTEWEDENNHDF